MKINVMGKSMALDKCFASLMVFIVAGLSLLPAHNVMADDIELLYAKQPGPDEAPNLYFLVDNSPSMTVERRVSLSAAFERLMENEKLQEMRIGMGFFAGGAGPHIELTQVGVKVPLSESKSSARQALLGNSTYTDISTDGLTDPEADASVSEYLNQLVQEFKEVGYRPYGGTPSLDALFEAGKYFYGEKGHHTRYLPQEVPASHPSSYDGDPADHAGKSLSERQAFNYKSPVKHACQPNNIIFLTDGGAYNSHVVKQVAEFIGPEKAQQCDTETFAQAVAREPLYANVGWQYEVVRCSLELVDYFANNDMFKEGNQWPKDQTIKTHTISFQLNDPAATSWLKAMAQKGGGEFFAAQNSDDLVSVFDNIVGSQDTGIWRSFLNPVYGLTHGTATSNSEYVYVPSFKLNALSPLWPGNLQKFRIKDSQMVDANGAVVSDSAKLGEIKDLWANEYGTGVYAQMNTQPPVVLTDNDKHGAPLVKIDSDSVSKADLGDTGLSDDDYNALLDTLNSIERVEGEAVFKPRMGALMHSQPILVNYDGGKKLLFFGTNNGYFRAVSADTGRTLFMYMPKEFIRDGYAQYLHADAADAKHRYGVDGSPSLYHHDTNNNGELDLGETAMIYFGTRRGNKNYYALDVSHDALMAAEQPTPKLAFKVKGDAEDCADNCFDNLGYSWATPKVGMLKLSHNEATAAKHNVNELVKKHTLEPHLFIPTGMPEEISSANRVNGQTSHRDYRRISPVKSRRGEQSSQSGDLRNLPSASAHKMAGVYVVNALTGEKLTFIASSGDDSSSVSDVKLLDLDSNGRVDRIYWVSLNGGVHRYDMKHVTHVHKKTKETKNSIKLASIGQPVKVSQGQQKFYATPEASVYMRNGHINVSLALGSGNRDAPNQTGTNNNFYVLHDSYAYGVKASEVELITDKDLSYIDPKIKNVDPLIKPRGWRMALDSRQGEKVISQALIFNGKVIFNSFIIADSVDICDTKARVINRSYALNLDDGKAFADLNADDKGDDRYVELVENDLAGQPQIIFDEAKSADGKACNHLDCEQAIRINVGITALSIVGEENASALSDITELQGQLKYWLQNLIK